MDWSGRPVLVTGAGGFIGSHLTEELLRRGAQVRAMVHGNMRGSIGHLRECPRDLTPSLEIIEGSTRDGAFVREATIGIDTVFHLAAVTSVKYSYTNPDETVVTNVTGTLNVCNACRHERVRRLVHTSSAGVYGSSEKGEAIDETHPVRAYNPYTASKLAADNVVESYYLSYDVPVSICRIFNIYGPRVGRFLVIPTIIQQILSANEVRLGDLTPTRNFTYVSDIVEAFVRMAEEDKVIGQVVNFGSSNAVTIGELAKLIAKAMETEIDIRFDPARIRPRKSEIFRAEADSTKAKKILGWEPTVPLDEGLRLTAQWIREVGYEENQGG